MSANSHFSNMVVKLRRTGADQWLLSAEVDGNVVSVLPLRTDEETALKKATTLAQWFGASLDVERAGLRPDGKKLFCVTLTATYYALARDEDEARRYADLALHDSGWEEAVTVITDPDHRPTGGWDLDSEVYGSPGESLEQAMGRGP